MEDNGYDFLSDKAKEVAPQIEKLLKGLTIDEAVFMLRKISKRILDITKIS